MILTLSNEDREKVRDYVDVLDRHLDSLSTMYLLKKQTLFNGQYTRKRENP